ncbi:MAG: hypothetical protein H8E98_07850 [Bacteroidetes bacterium]|nr:hypothetical protein [Bacteroidota bacterium]
MKNYSNVTMICMGLLFSILLFSCEKVEVSNENNTRPPMSKFEQPWGDLLIIGETVVLPNGWFAYADISLLGEDPIRPQIEFYDAVYEGQMVTGPNGFQFICCPQAGTNCGDVYDINTETAEFRYIGKYLTP